MYATATRYTLRRFTSSKKPLITRDLDASGLYFNGKILDMQTQNGVHFTPAARTV
jgi:hypothetical protein